MKQVVQNLKTGKILVEDVPPPALAPGRVLVSNQASLVSAGTERAKVETARKSLVGKARARPDLVKQVVDSAKAEGLAATYQKVKARLESLAPIGYSCAGVVLEVAPDVEGMAVGDAVACAGGGYANHAEVVCVPQNLTARVPQGVALDAAAYTTIGAIAMQGIRQADVGLGECVAVIGLGLVGQLACQIAKAAGCRVIGFDLSPEAAELAGQNWADDARPLSGPAAVEAAMSFSDGRGLDAVVITAATHSSEPVETAGLMARRKGKVVIVGDVGLDIPRAPYYEKELDLRLSTSYGPGRYDPTYEEEGRDYPYGYVRWTERRNMQEFLRLLSQGLVSTEALTTHRFSIDEAPDAYDLVTSQRERYVGILLEYPGWKPSRVEVPAASRIEAVKGQTRIALIGAGSFATRVLVPALKADGRARLVTVVSASGVSAQNAADKQGFARADASVEAACDAEDVDALVIASRHDTHADFAIKGLNAGKAVFVEKPPAMNSGELQMLAEAYASSDAPLMVGFNRFFSPHMGFIRDAFAQRSGPIVAACRVNAGPLPDDSWILSPTQGGGRILGEGCHFIDLLIRLVGAAPTSVSARRATTDKPAAAEDNVAIAIGFSDGSVTNLIYTSAGDPTFGKERVEAFCEGTAALIDDFSLSSVTKGGHAETKRTRTRDKGHHAELSRFLDLAVARQKDDNLVFWQLLAMHVTLLAIESTAMGQPVRIEVPAWLDWSRPPRLAN